MSTVLAIRDLRVGLRRGRDEVEPVDGVTLEVAAGECVALVGESGSGKSLTLKAVLGLLPRGAAVTGGTLELAPGRGAAPAPYRPEDVRGHGIAMVFQEPMTALDPTRRVVDLVADAAVVHGGMRRRAARARAVELLREVGVPDPERRAHAWPHELSGGLRQRVMIAMALAGAPRLLLCDEPTTALDVTVQDQILGLLDRLRRERGLAVLFVSHDLAVVAQIAQRVAVMYAGGIVETGPTRAVFGAPRHAYTAALVAAVPSPSGGARALRGIGGSPPDPADRPPGCRFAPRCTFAIDACRTQVPPVARIADDRTTSCLRHGMLAVEEISR